MQDTYYLCDVVRDPARNLLRLTVVESWARSDWASGTALPKDLDGDLLAAIAHAVDTGAPAGHECQLPPAGRWSCVHLLPQRGRIGLLFEDISERRADRERLRVASDVQHSCWR